MPVKEEGQVIIIPKSDKSELTRLLEEGQIEGPFGPVDFNSFNADEEQAEKQCALKVRRYAHSQGHDIAEEVDSSYILGNRVTNFRFYNFS